MKLTKTRSLLKFGLVFVFSFIAINAIGGSKTEAASCYPPATAAYYNATIAVRIFNPDGTFKKWSSNFNINVEALNPAPYGPSSIPINTAINWPGKPGFPTSNITFNATAGGPATLSCPTWDGTNATKLIFGDGTDGYPYLACLWGTWGKGPGKEHGLGFRFTPISVGDAGGSGYFKANQAFGQVWAGQGGGTIDVNNQLGNYVFDYQLTSTANNPEGLVQADCNAITGWARDDDIAGPIEVHLFFDNMAAGIPGVIADKPHPTQGNHGYLYPMSSVTLINPYDGNQHTVKAVGINQGGGGNNELSGTWYRFGPCPPSNSRTNVYPSTIFNPDDNENPVDINFGARVEQAGTDYAVEVTRSYFILRADGSVVPIPGLPNAVETITGDKTYPTVTTSASILNVGDKACTQIKVNKREVSIGYLGAETVVVGEYTSPPDCKRKVNKPYVSFYGGDVFAGGGFGTTACNNVGDVKGYINAASRGSSAQLAVFAIGVIETFSSASLTNPPNALRFANTTTPNGTFTGDHCIRDYYNDALFTPRGGAVNFSVANTHSGQKVVRQNTNLTISENQILQDFTDINSIPSLYVVVQGDIFIDKDVSRLDGVYIAQPRADGTGGKIYTCTNGSTPYASASDLYINCNIKLTVNGALIAKDVKFLRAKGSQRDWSGDGRSGAAEEINYLPELFLAKPTAPDPVSSGASQYITTLPPIL